MQQLCVFTLSFSAHCVAVPLIRLSILGCGLAPLAGSKSTGVGRRLLIWPRGGSGGGRWSNLCCSVKRWHKNAWHLLLSRPFPDISRISAASCLRPQVHGGRLAPHVVREWTLARCGHILSQMSGARVTVVQVGSSRVFVAAHTGV